MRPVASLVGLADVVEEKVAASLYDTGVAEGYRPPTGVPLDVGMGKAE